MDFAHNQSQQSSSLVATDGHFKNQSCSPALQARTKMSLNLETAKMDGHKFHCAQQKGHDWSPDVPFGCSNIYLSENPPLLEGDFPSPNKHPALCSSMSLSPASHVAATPLPDPNSLLSLALQSHSPHTAGLDFIFFFSHSLSFSVCVSCALFPWILLHLKPSNLFTVGLPPLYVSNLTAASFNSPVWRLHDKADMGF